MEKDVDMSPDQISMDSPATNLKNGKGKAGKIIFVILCAILLVVVFSVVSMVRNKMHKGDEPPKPAETTAKQGEVRRSQLAHKNLGDKSGEPPPPPPVAAAPQPSSEAQEQSTQQGQQQPGENAGAGESQPKRPLRKGETQSTTQDSNGGSSTPQPVSTIRFTKAGPLPASGGSSGTSNQSGGGQTLSSEERFQRAVAAAQNQGQPQAKEDDSLKAAVPLKHMASYLPDRSWLVTAGTMTPCILQTKIVTSVSGRTRCVLPYSVYSDDGKMLLIEKGSEVIGEYQAGMKQGQARIFVLWTRLKSPNGVIVNLDSPGAGALGEAGVDGYIDNHFFQRFGAAILVSVIQDAAEYAANKGNSQTNNTVNIGGSTAQAGSNVATEILKSSINIPPTLYKNQGEQIAIYIARDLDFTGVYDAQRSLKSN